MKATAQNGTLKLKLNKKSQNLGNITSITGYYPGMDR